MTFIKTNKTPIIMFMIYFNTANIINLTFICVCPKLYILPTCLHKYK